MGVFRPGISYTPLHIAQMSRGLSAIAELLVFGWRDAAVQRRICVACDARYFSLGRQQR